MNIDVFCVQYVLWTLMIESFQPTRNAVEDLGAKRHPRLGLPEDTLQLGTVSKTFSRSGSYQSSSS